MSARATLTIIDRARRFMDATAVREPAGDHSYAQLLDDSENLAMRLLDDTPDLAEQPVAFLCSPGYRYVVAQWAIWRAGGIGVPLAVSHPAGELAYALDHTRATTLIADRDLRDRIESLARERALRIIDPGDTDPFGDGAASRATTARATGLPRVAASRRAVIFFTSGTTGRPKGAVWTHRTIEAQAGMLEASWGWRSDDTILSVLPLHHVHGVINVLTTALWSGATWHVQPTFDAVETWEALAGGRVSVFMAVPTIYVRLIKAWREAPSDVQARWSAGAARLRLMVSGSAALPVSVLAEWETIAGHRLLERYGMTELGMALSNPLAGERVAGTVGHPLPGVEVRLVDEEIRDVGPGQPGEILVRGPGVFLEYWRDPRATSEAFVDGWFRTGDVAVVEASRYRILGRNSSDIIKTGGFKVSALEIEEAIREHPDVEDCAVVGLPDDEWGQRVAVAVVPAAGHEATLEVLRAGLGERLAPYKLPSRLVSVDDLPRNAMGKVVKADVATLFSGGSHE